MGVPSTALPKAFSTSAASEARSITARLCRSHHRQQLHLRARRASSPLRVRGQSKKVRALGEFLSRRARRNPHLPRHLRDGFTPPWKSRTFLPTPSSSPRRLRRHLRQVHEFSRVHWISAIRALSAGLLLRQRRIHSGASHLHPRRRQAAPHVRIGSRRSGRVWVPRTAGDKCAIRKSIPEKERCTSSKSGIRNTATSSRAMGTRAIFKVRVRGEKLGHRRPADGLPSTSPTSTPKDSRPASSKASSRSTRRVLSATIRASRP